MTVLFIDHCFYFLQLVAVLKTLQLHPPAVYFYISIFVTINLLFQKIFTPHSSPPFFVWTCLPSPSSSFYSDFPLKNSLSLFSGNTILFALLPEIRGCKIQNFLIIEYKKITNFSLSRCHYFLSFDLTKWTCYSVLWIFKWWLRNHDPFFA